jgi:hypothetical protein
MPSTYKTVDVVERTRDVEVHADVFRFRTWTETIAHEVGASSWELSPDSDHATIRCEQRGRFLHVSHTMAVAAATPVTIVSRVITSPAHQFLQRLLVPCVIALGIWLGLLIRGLHEYAWLQAAIFLGICGLFACTLWLPWLHERFLTRLLSAEQERLESTLRRSTRTRVAVTAPYRDEISRGRDEPAEEVPSEAKGRGGASD